MDPFHQSDEVTTDGRFLFVAPRPLAGSRSARVIRVDNWFRDLRARARTVTKPAERLSSALRDSYRIKRERRQARMTISLLPHSGRTDIAS